MTPNSLKESSGVALRWLCTAVAAIALSTPLYAQIPTCKGFLAKDGGLPSYPPIARTAHIQATLRFKIVVPRSGNPQISLLQGRNGGHREACSYIAEVEYRMGPEFVDPPNNFLRVTVIDENHTLVEVRARTVPPSY
jgi:hypothetical protein